MSLPLGSCTPCWVGYLAYNSLGLDFSPHALPWLSPEVQGTSCITTWQAYRHTLGWKQKDEKREKSALL